MSKKGMLRSALLSYAMLGAMDYARGTNYNKEEKINPEEEEKIRIAQEREQQKNHGLKEFIINGISIMAINEKNAIRKFNKIKDKL